MNDNLILVDIYDNPIGTENKAATHKLGKLHRAFSVFIVSGDKMLIQRRNMNKYHSGGIWANACCSHPRHGEDLAEAVQRRMQEEIGISCHVEKQFEFIYFTRFSDDLYEYEYDHVFLGTFTGPVDYNEDEIIEIKWVTFNELKTWMLERPQEFSSWFHIAAPRIIKTIENL